MLQHSSVFSLSLARHQHLTQSSIDNFRKLKDLPSLWVIGPAGKCRITQNVRCSCQCPPHAHGHEHH
ncbi:Proheparin-binding EGF-like growth factor [Frankliniella fusca]|uniref:Proheparin-binding EGF-like growth factor n=1 Tax=Frankliniella fusca TaxID=407009 RepID=A0AAE1I1I2_9NEOP|nr:Proheparin-binding EGF-like growth factor [Frankliniella fusca]